MNFKSSHLLGSLLAAAALGTFAGTASAADACLQIEGNISAHSGHVAEALLAHFGGDDHLAELGRNNNRFQFMRLRNPGKLSDVGGCTVRYSVEAQKYSPATDPVVGVAPGHAEETRDGKVDWRIEFDATQGTKLCIKSQHIISVNWKDEGRVKEKIFRNANGDKKYFAGCLGG